jgi:carboxymethylenebutenolidase
MPDITLHAADGTELRGYLATPPIGDGPWPGVVLIHDAMGLSDDARVNADLLAAGGYVALAPDLYSRGGMLRCVKATFRDLSAGRGQAFGDLEAARQWLLDRDDSNGRTGVIGFCMGGGFALLSATRGFDASSVNYGQLPENPDEVLAGACPIVGSFGARDFTLKGAAAQLTAVLDKAGVDSDIKEYPGVGHSFLNRFNTGPFSPIVKVLGFNYDQPTAEDAWRRIFTFFAKHLKPA